MKLFFCLILLSISQVVFADANSCDDYLSRHYRRNLIPTSISFHNRNISEPYQEVKLSIKNVGEVAFSEPGLKWMKVKIKNNIRSIQVPMPIGVGQTIILSIAVDPNLLRNCERVPVTIDLDHTVGQWGCQVWNDDSKILQAHLIGGHRCFPWFPPVHIPVTE